jgi:hypothetical protein
MIQCKVDGIWKNCRRRCLPMGDPKTFLGHRFIFGKDERVRTHGRRWRAALAVKKRRELSFEAEAIGIEIPEPSKDSNADRLKSEQAVNLYFSDEVPEEGQLPE